jgi:hypothetical protein
MCRPLLSLLYRHFIHKSPNPYLQTHNAHLLVLTESCSNRNLQSNIEARVRGDLPKQHDTQLQNFQLLQCKPLNVLEMGVPNIPVFNIGYPLENHTTKRKFDSTLS